MWTVDGNIGLEPGEECVSSYNAQTKTHTVCNYNPTGNSVVYETLGASFVFGVLFYFCGGMNNGNSDAEHMEPLMAADEDAAEEMDPPAEEEAE